MNNFYKIGVDIALKEAGLIKEARNPSGTQRLAEQEMRYFDPKGKTPLRTPLEDYLASNMGKQDSKNRLFRSPGSSVIADLDALDAILARKTPLQAAPAEISDLIWRENKITNPEVREALVGAHEALYNKQYNIERSMRARRELRSDLKLIEDPLEAARKLRQGASGTEVVDMIEQAKKRAKRPVISGPYSPRSFPKFPGGREVRKGVPALESLGYKFQGAKSSVGKALQRALAMAKGHPIATGLGAAGLAGAGIGLGSLLSDKD